MAKKGSLTLFADRCKGCGLCVKYCPRGILGLQGELNPLGYRPVNVTHEERCSGCGFCALMCPDMIIRVERGDRVESPLAERQ